MTIFKTFKDFLKTGSTEDLHEKCGPFLEQSGGLPLYRGYGGKTSNLLNLPREVTIRKDRRPRDSKQFVHDLMDAYFQEMFGEKIRSAGLFATGNLTTAARYGVPHYVFPVGEFKYVWAESQGSPVVDTIRLARTIEYKMMVSHDAEKHDITRKIMDELDWHTDGLEKAIRSGAEIALLTDRAILIPVGKKPYSEIIGR